MNDSSNSDRLVGMYEIRDAKRRIGHLLRATPTFRSDSLSRTVGYEVLFKPEHRQRTGSFKIRGAASRISAIDAPGVPVVAASAGNHAQGVALAARSNGREAIVFMPRSASAAKVQAVKDYGATLHLVGETVDDAIREAEKFASERNFPYVHPFDDPVVIAGQGTAGLEAFGEARELLAREPDVVVVPVGGGGLVSGIAVAVKSEGRNTRVVGVEAEGAASMKASLEAGHPVKVDVRTVADGIAVRSPSRLTLAHVRALVDEIVTVSDDEITRAMVFLLEREKMLVEPAGATGVAAVLEGKVGGDGVVVVLSGGNVDLLLLARLIEHGLSAAGRYLRLRVFLPDRPGALARLAAVFGSQGMNIVDVEHHRAGAPVGVEEVEVYVTAESRGPGESALLIDALRREGIKVEPF